MKIGKRVSITDPMWKILTSDISTSIRDLVHSYWQWNLLDEQRRGGLQAEQDFWPAHQKTATHFHQGWRHSTSHKTACQVDFTASMSEQDIW